MQLLTNFGAVLVLIALLALALPALAHSQHWNAVRAFYRRKGWGVRSWRDLIAAECGYNTVYCWPGGSAGQSTTAPTAIQASQVNLQTAAIAIGDAETFAYFTHNWGLGASFPSFMWPLISYRQSDIGTGPSTQLGALTFNIANTNAVIINKVAGVGNGGTFIVTLMRPPSQIR